MVNEIGLVSVLDSWLVSFDIRGLASIGFWQTCSYAFQYLLER